MLVDIHGKIKSQFFFHFICTFVLWYDKWYICQFAELCFFVHVLTVSYVYKTLKMPAHWCINKLMFYIYLTFQNISNVN